MGWYHERILPHMIDSACSAQPIMEARKPVVLQCRGEVLEVGAGSGINFSLYDPSLVTKVWALEPSWGMRRRAQKRLPVRPPMDIEWLDLPGEAIPLADHSVDTVLLTYTLCTIGDTVRALAQMHRVLKPGGQLLYCEHGLAPDHGIQRIQHLLTPVWKRLAGGCHLNRPISQYICQAGFELSSDENRYLNKLPRFAGYTYSGRALKVP